MKSMLHSGYTWVVVDALVETEVPSLPDFFQKALNAANSIAMDSSELEVS